MHCRFSFQGNCIAKRRKERFVGHFAKVRELYNLITNEIKAMKSKMNIGIASLGTDTSIVQHALDTIDSEITKAVLQTKQATATRSLWYAWSPTLTKTGHQVTFWCNCLWSAKHCRDPFLHLIPSQLQHHGICHTRLRLAFYKSWLDNAWSKTTLINCVEFSSYPHV